MAIEPDEDEHEDLTIEKEALEPEPDEIDPPEVEEDEPPETEEPDEDDDDVVISFGDEPGAQPADSAPIRALREENRRQARELAELRKANAPKPVELGPRPTLESCDYDEDKFAAATETWLGRKARADEEQRQRQRAEEQVQADFREDLAKFSRQKADLKIKNFQTLEETACAGLNDVQQTAIVKAADNSAKVIAALGMHPAKLAELAKITDPVKFIAAIVKFEGSLKVTTRKQAPAPDRPVRGSAPFVAGKTDKALEKLEKEAERSGDRTHVVNYKREQRDKLREKGRR